MGPGELLATGVRRAWSELPELEVSRHRQGQGDRPGVNMESIEKGRLRTFVEQQFLSYPILLAGEQPRRTELIGPVDGLLTSYLVSPTGEVVARQVGQITADAINSFIDNYEKTSWRSEIMLRFLFSVVLFATTVATAADKPRSGQVLLQRDLWQLQGRTGDRAQRGQTGHSVDVRDGRVPVLSSYEDHNLNQPEVAGVFPRAFPGFFRWISRATEVTGFQRCTDDHEGFRIQTIPGTCDPGVCVLRSRRQLHQPALHRCDA